MSSKRKNVLIKDSAPQHQACSKLDKESGSSSENYSKIGQASNSESETEIRNGNMLSGLIQTRSPSTGVGQAWKRRHEVNHPVMHYWQ